MPARPITDNDNLGGITMQMIRSRAGTALLSLALGLVSLAAHAAGAPDFSGTWQINPAKSENLGMMSAVKQTLVVTQSAGELKIAETSDFQGQKTERSVRYDLKGAPVVNEAAMGGKSETVAKWEGDRLVVTWTTEGTVAGTKNVRTENRSLGADGKTMRVESIRGTNKPVVMVFDRIK